MSVPALRSVCPEVIEVQAYVAESRPAGCAVPVLASLEGCPPHRQVIHGELLRARGTQPDSRTLPALVAPLAYQPAYLTVPNGQGDSFQPRHEVSRR